MTSGWLLWISFGLGCALLALTLIDVRTFRLPDLLTLPTLVAGLGITAAFSPESIVGHLFGAAAGYGVFAAIGWLYAALRGRDGLGLGDAKLLAAGGAWLSWQALPYVVLIAATLALLVSTVAHVARAVMPAPDRPRSASSPLSGAARIPFGPYLAAAIWLLWLYGTPNSKTEE
jgi:leader peptidase (prepilin peptidase)/N-methyltransferase